MTNYRIIWWLLSIAVTTGTAIAGRPDHQPETLNRAGKWHVDYDKDACHLTRQFGTGDKEIIARFTRYEPGDAFTFTLFGERLRAAGPEINTKLDFGIGIAPKRLAMGARNGKLPVLIFNTVRLDGWTSEKDDDTPPKITPEQETAITGVTVSIAGWRPFRLVTGSLGKPMAALRTCTTDLVRHWGYDPAVQAQLARPATPVSPSHSWLRSSDYPATAARGGINGVVQFRLDIDGNGAVSSCHILYRTNPDEFADTTCKAIMRRAKFLPALDAKNVPIRTFYVGRVHWRMAI